MAGQGRRVTFHGAFSDKADAIRKERQVHGFIKPAMVRGARRYVVMTGNRPARARASRDHPVSAGTSRASGAGDWSVWLLGAGALALWFLAKAPAPGSSRPAAVPLTATAMIDSTGRTVGWYLVNADGSTTQWDPNGVLA
jgi:hypothetical protein